MRRGFVIAFASGCGMLGGSGGEPAPPPLGGTGLFQPLTREQTGLGDPEGRVFAGPAGAIDGFSVVDGHLFFAGSDFLSSPPAPAEPAPVGTPDWTQFAPRTIRRADSDDPLHFAEPTEPALEAEVSWEGDEVYDPWAIETSSGQVHLYYAAQGGIGVAIADDAAGAFERPVDEPIVAATESALLRRPSVVITGAGEFLMFYESASTIALARSSDGLTFDVVGSVISPAEGELRVGAPGAVRVTTPIGRELVRVYFERTLEDGTTEITLAAAEPSASVFEPFSRAVTESEAPRFPVTITLDDRSTLLYFVTSHTDLFDREIGALVAAVQGDL